jgi:glycosyltransferase involved in cell wall biosynthesis
VNQPSVVLVTPWYGHFAGGAEVAARSFAEHLARRRIAVQVLTTCCRSPYDSWWEDTLAPGTEAINGVTVHRFPVDSAGADHYHQVWHQLLHGLPATPAEERQCVRGSINSQALLRHAATLADDSVIVALPYTQGLTYSLVEALPNRVIVMPCLHDEPQARWVTTRELLEGARHAFFFSEEEKTLAIRLFGRLLGRRLVEFPVIGIGVEMPSAQREQVSNLEALQSVRRRYGLPETYWVCMGRKDVGKGIATLVRYFEAYRAEGRTAGLVLLGGGDVTLVPQRDGFVDLGAVPEEDKCLILSQAFGLIHLSERESFCLAVMEAWLCGKPVIVSAGCEVTATHCRRSSGGLAVASAQEFAAALRLIEDSAVGDTLGAAGRRYVEAQYCWDHVLDRLFRAVAST